MGARIEPVGQLRGDKLRELTRSWWWRGTIALGPVAAGSVAAVAVPAAPLAAFFGAAAVVAIVVVIATVMIANGRAQSAFLEAWATARGWRVDSSSWIGEATPLLRDGDRRSSEHYLSGPLPGGGKGVLCHYTYEVKHTSTDSKGHTTTSWEAHPFTVVETNVAAPELPRVTLHPRSFGDNALFDKIDSAVTSDRVVNLESSELEHEYKLEVADETSDVALRRLFEPSFIVWCIDNAPTEMMFELERNVLVVAIPGHSYDAAELDGLLDKASFIAAALAGARSTSGVN